MVIATPSDVLVFSLDAYFKDKKPRIKHVLNIASGKNASKYDGLYNAKSQYDGGKGLTRSRGWLYGFIGNEEMSSFCAIGFDGLNSIFFNEIRTDGKTISVEDGLSDFKYNAKTATAKLEDKRKTITWKGLAPEFEVDITIKNGKDELSLHYSFTKLNEKIGPYRGVFEQYQQIQGNFTLSPVKGKLTINAKGDISKLGYADLKPLIGKIIESNFAYVEVAHVAIPFISVGWKWSILGCQKHFDQGINLEKFAGFFELFVTPTHTQIPLNYNLYSIDLATGQINVVPTADVQENGNNFTVENTDAQIKLEIQNNPSKTYEIKGKKLAHYFSTADIKYTAYTCIAKATISGKEYKAIGNSEQAGGNKNYWL